MGTGQLEKIMKMTKIALLVVAIAVALYILIPSLAWSETGAALNNAKYIASHSCEQLGITYATAFWSGEKDITMSQTDSEKDRQANQSGRSIHCDLRHTKRSKYIARLSWL